MKKKLQNLKVSKKLQLSFVMVIGIFVIAIAAAFFFLLQISSSLTQFYNVPFTNRVAVTELRRDIQSASKNILWSMTTDDETITAEKVTAASEDLEKMMAQLEILEGNFTNKELMEDLSSAVETVNKQAENALSYASQNQNTQALLIFNGELSDAISNLTEAAAAISDFTLEKSESDYSSAMGLRNLSFIVMIALSLISILVAIYMGNTLSRILTGAIFELKAAAEALSKGELEIAITYQSEDELGQLSRSFHETCDGLKAIINDMGVILKSLSKQDLSVSSSCREKYKGAFKPLLDNLGATFRALSDTVGQISEASNQVSLGSTQLSENAQSLAEGATEQASAIEELQATVADISGQIDNNTAEVRKVNERVQKVGDEAENSNQEMQSMTEAMLKIKENSSQIVNIISGIEDIATQTNMLSLNAAIEAARAGEAGKGFAVVADQIGKLADESAKSAVSTRELIETSIRYIDDGNEITEKTAESLTKVIEGVLEIKESVNTVNAASEQQSEAVKQIEQGVEQISGVVQSNSASAEETSATSEELNAQAASLNELVGQFVLRTEK